MPSNSGVSVGPGSAQLWGCAADTHQSVIVGISGTQPGTRSREKGSVRMRRSIVLLFVVSLLAVMVAAVPAGANGADGPKKVWLCHFEDNNHNAPVPYADDRNGDAPGFWGPTPDDEYLDGDYMVRYNTESYAGIPAGLNPGQVGLCEGNLGEFILVSVNSLGSDEDERGHRAQNLFRLDTYPNGWKG